MVVLGRPLVDTTAAAAPRVLFVGSVQAVYCVAAVGVGFEPVFVSGLVCLQSVNKRQ